MIEELGGYKVHPIASLFPMIPDDELQALADDIKANGQRENIVLMPMGPETEEYWLVDGRNRFRACEMAGVEPQYGMDNRYFGEPDLIGPWIISHNLHRRHLTASQRAAIAVEYEKRLAIEAAARQRAGKPVEAGGRASDLAGELLGVSGRTVRDAKFVAEHDPGLFERVRAGEVSASLAASSIRESDSKRNTGDNIRRKFACDGDDGWETLFRTVTNGLKNLAEDENPERRRRLESQLNLIKETIKGIDRGETVGSGRGEYSDRLNGSQMILELAIDLEQTAKHFRSVNPSTVSRDDLREMDAIQRSYNDIDRTFRDVFIPKIIADSIAEESGES